MTAGIEEEASAGEPALGDDTGSAYHCAPTDRRWRNEVVIDGLDRTLG